MKLVTSAEKRKRRQEKLKVRARDRQACSPQIVEAFEIPCTTTTTLDPATFVCSTSDDGESSDNSVDCQRSQPIESVEADQNEHIKVESSEEKEEKEEDTDFVASEDCVEELCALAAIFMDEMKVLSSIPPTLLFTFASKSIALVVTLCARYPNSIPRFSIIHLANTGTDTDTDTSSSSSSLIDESLINLLQGIANAMLGDPMVFSLVEAARDWLEHNTSNATGAITSTTASVSNQDNCAVQPSPSTSESANVVVVCKVQEVAVVSVPVPFVQPMEPVKEHFRHHPQPQPLHQPIQATQPTDAATITPPESPRHRERRIERGPSQPNIQQVPVQQSTTTSATSNTSSLKRSEYFIHFSNLELWSDVLLLFVVVVIVVCRGCAH
jgi:hypothetical protein